jgi:EAL and modified HD-GYP domain-containing signal transduction protein
VPLRPLDAIPVVVRAEIIDQRHRLCGYRFHAVARQHGTPLAENAMVAALQEARVLEFAAQRLALIPLSLDAVTLAAICRCWRRTPCSCWTGAIASCRSSNWLAAGGARGHRRPAGLARRVAGAGRSAFAGTVRHGAAVPGMSIAPAFQALIKQLRQRYPALKLCVDGRIVE